jgi:hypothetical protein
MVCILNSEFEGQVILYITLPSTNLLCMKNVGTQWTMVSLQ